MLACVRSDYLDPLLCCLEVYFPRPLVALQECGEAQGLAVCDCECFLRFGCCLPAASVRVSAPSLRRHVGLWSRVCSCNAELLGLRHGCFLGLSHGWRGACSTLRQALQVRSKRTAASTWSFLLGGRGAQNCSRHRARC
eukprot:Amastigsp_a676911_43.p3 type:complete len:139 gc:universal Amastigsp_a676911_43:301-717(+)